MSPLRAGGISRPAWAPAPSTGLFGALYLRAVDRWRGTDTNGRNHMGKDTKRTEAEEKFFALRESGYRGPITETGDKATRDNTSPELLDTLAAVHDLPAWDSYQR